MLLIILFIFSDTWRIFAHFEHIKTLLQKIKNCFAYSPIYKNRYLNHLQLNGVASPQKIPLPVKTR